MRTGFRLGNLKERVYLEDEVVDERIILKRENCARLGYYAASNGTLLPTFRDNLSVPSSRAGYCKDGAEPSCSIKFGEFSSLAGKLSASPLST